ncbi:hypothetical protein O7602_06925 [Micromonospora sp. WMMD1128]|uniref:hypothetical protein n=1 Tax=unclassified Micromonospora TaxID=2617518 RepID=UPI00248D2FF4|nr:MULTISPECIES: hypothetical protein [unclassified Micromonospora]WBB76975.1 hypothetical protein O7602_06925 [Micromonospora sp. WMMD1128]WFE36726.1 hypothetical protein O7613_17200 [Micromonospora sp. WMMD975]
MLIDCDGCGIRGAGCSGCLVTALLDPDSPTADLGPAEHRAIEVFARAGFDVEVLPLTAAPAPAPAPAPRRAARRRVA